MLEALEKREIHFISEQTEEVLFKKIMDSKVHLMKLMLVRGLCKLRVAEIQWMRFKGMDV